MTQADKQTKLNGAGLLVVWASGIKAGIEAARSGRVEEVIRDADYALAEALRCASKVQP